MTMKFAATTKVSVSGSRRDIDKLLTQFKASRIGVITELGAASVGFTIGDWSVLFKMNLPMRDETRFTHKNSYSRRLAATAEKMWEQACRSCWRALLLTVKAKLVAVESGVETFEQAFLAHLVIPGSHGVTVGEAHLPLLQHKNAEMKKLSAGGPA